ncbi:50S ribosomal protein L29 [Candidatus Uhrbacteria bacterium]|jgi:ribosomal protein L29|nr:MAG: 50S ribosomal protein L29 [Candidatus Uhrbacteria bacterium]
MSKELQQKSAAELSRDAADLRSSIRELRFKIATRQHGKVRDMRLKKRDLARLLTALATKPKSEITLA